MTLRLLLRLLAVTALAATALATIGAAPASAVPRDRVIVPLGTTVIVEYPQLVGNNYATGRRPASCAAETKTSCDTIPVTLDLPVEVLQAGQYNFLVTTRWQTRAEPTVPAFGKVPDDQVNTYIYTDPPRVVDDVITDETSAFMVPPPTTLSLFQPQTNTFLITVENMYGLNSGYTLEFLLIDLAGGPGADLSEDQPPADLSDDGDVAVTPSFSGDEFNSSSLFGEFDASDLGGPGAPAFEFFGGPGALTLDVLDVAGDPELDRLAGVEGSSFNLSEAREIVRASSGPPTPRSASPLVLLFWFLVLPAAVAGVPAAMVVRRRRALA